MYRGYPVGELMFWDVSADGETRSIAGTAVKDALFSVGASRRTAKAHEPVRSRQRATGVDNDAIQLLNE
jgi:hypothetical protein